MASIMLLNALLRFTGVRGLIRGGGNGDGGYGLVAPYRGHYWVEAHSQCGVFIIDVTGDQFGEPPVLIERIEAAAARYHNGDQTTVDAQVDACRRELEKG